MVLQGKKGDASHFRAREFFLGRLFFDSFCSQLLPSVVVVVVRASVGSIIIVFVPSSFSSTSLQKEELFLRGPVSPSPRRHFTHIHSVLVLT